MITSDRADFHGGGGDMNAVRPAWPERTLLGMLTDRDAADLGRLGRPRSFGPGERLVTEGEIGLETYVLLSGVVKILSHTADGRRVLLTIRVAGDLVGELAVLDDQPRVATVDAAGPVTTRVVDGPTFLRFLDERPAVARAVNRAVSNKLRMATRHRIDSSGAPVGARVVRVLGYLADVYGETPAGHRPVDVPLTQHELGALVGASLPSLQRELRRLRDSGLVRTGHGRIVVLRPAELRTLAP